MDPSVALVEELMVSAASHTLEEPARRQGILVADYAIWLCACETFDESPQWLIFSVGSEGVGWQRLDHRLELFEVVDAKLLAGGHPAPRAVLRWLRDGAAGEAPYFADDREFTTGLFAEIQRRVRRGLLSDTSA